MTKRHPALIPLTHDHHHALAQARRLIEASGGDADDRRAAAEAFVDFYERDTLLHFREEEEVLFPVLLESLDEAPEDLARVLVEHVQMHGLVGRMRLGLESGALEPELLRTMGEVLRSHIRLEEGRLFPLIESAASDSDLAQMAFVERHRDAK